MHKPRIIAALDLVRTWPCVTQDHYGELNERPVHQLRMNIHPCHYNTGHLPRILAGRRAETELRL